jgi:hypothetical protein
VRAARSITAAEINNPPMAFTHGMDVALLVSAGIAVAGLVIALAFLPRRSAAAPGAQATPAERRKEHVAVPG